MKRVPLDTALGTLDPYVSMGDGGGAEYGLALTMRGQEEPYLDLVEGCIE
jgi:hypothetical protein